MSYVRKQTSSHQRSTFKCPASRIKIQDLTTHSEDKTLQCSTQSNMYDTLAEVTLFYYFARLNFLAETTVLKFYLVPHLKVLSIIRECFAFYLATFILTCFRNQTSRRSKIPRNKSLITMQKFPTLYLTGNRWCSSPLPLWRHRRGKIVVFELFWGLKAILKVVSSLAW